MDLVVLHLKEEFCSKLPLVCRTQGFLRHTILQLRFGKLYLGTRRKAYLGPRGEAYLEPRGEAYLEPRGEAYLEPRGEAYLEPRGEAYLGPRGEAYLGQTEWEVDDLLEIFVPIHVAFHQ